MMPQHPYFRIVFNTYKKDSLQSRVPCRPGAELRGAGWDCNARRVQQGEQSGEKGVKLGAEKEEAKTLDPIRTHWDCPGLECC